MYVITGASGNIGKLVAEELLTSGKKVRVIGRNADKLKNLAEKGAEVFTGDLSDSEFVTNAFAGAEAVFCLIPPSMHATDYRKEQQKIAQNYKSAVEKNNIKFVVLLSSIGAHLRNGAGIVDGLGDMEEYFKELKGTNVLNLRPSYFMENLLGQIGMIKHFGFMGSPVKADFSIPIVATKDIAQMSATYLKNLSFSGNIVEYVLGERDITFNEIAAIFGKAINKPDLKYVQLSYDDAKKGMVGSGMCSENIADLMNGLSKGLNEGTVASDHKRTKENTTPTSIEDFADIFAFLYKQ